MPWYIINSRAPTQGRDRAIRMAADGGADGEASQRGGPGCFVLHRFGHEPQRDHRQAGDDDLGPDGSPGEEEHVVDRAKGRRNQPGSRIQEPSPQGKSGQDGPDAEANGQQPRLHDRHFVQTP